MGCGCELEAANLYPHLCNDCLAKYRDGGSGSADFWILARALAARVTVLEQRIESLEGPTPAPDFLAAYVLERVNMDGHCPHCEPAAVRERRTPAEGPKCNRQSVFGEWFADLVEELKNGLVREEAQARIAELEAERGELQRYIAELEGACAAAGVQRKPHGQAGWRATTTTH